MANEVNYYEIIKKLLLISDKLSKPDYNKCTILFYEANAIIWEYDFLKNYYQEQLKNAVNYIALNDYIKAAKENYHELREKILINADLNDTKIFYEDDMSSEKGNTNFNYRSFAQHLSVIEQFYKNKEINNQQLTGLDKLISESQERSLWYKSVPCKEFNDRPALYIFESLMATILDKSDEKDYSKVIVPSIDLRNFYVDNFGIDKTIIKIAKCIKREYNLEYIINSYEIGVYHYSSLFEKCLLITALNKIISDLLLVAKEQLKNSHSILNKTKEQSNKVHLIEIIMKNNKEIVKLDKRIVNLSPILVDILKYADSGKTKNDLDKLYHRDISGLVFDLNDFFREYLSPTKDKKYTVIKNDRTTGKFKVNLEFYNLDIDNECLKNF